jgi:SAM-dependent methyltransferase
MSEEIASSSGGFPARRDAHSSGTVLPSVIGAQDAGVDGMKHERHEHAGKGSERFFAAADVLAEAGVAGGVLLDVGCATGHFSLAAAERVDQVIAFDIHEPSLAALRRQAPPNLRAYTHDANSPWPLEDGSIDTCVLSNVMHGFVINQEAEAVIGEIARVLKAGGRLLIVEFKADQDEPGPPPDVRLGKRQLIALLSPRFAWKRSFQAGDHHDAFVFERQ